MSPPEHATDGVVGNVQFRPFSEAGFIEDLATASAVIASAGFTLMGEAVALGKPMLAIPLRRQFEQLLNARYLSQSGYGLEASDLGDGDATTKFFDHLDDYRENLTAYTHDHNAGLLSALDGFLS